MPINTGNNPRMQFPGIKAIFDNASMNYKPIWSQIFHTEKADKGREIAVEHTQFGYARRKGQGQAIQFDQDRQGYTVETYIFTVGIGFEVTIEEIQDNQYAKVGASRASALARSMDQYKELTAANIFNRAEDSNYNLGDTGVPLISASHPSRDAGLQSNVVGGDLSHGVLYDAFTAAENAEDARGLKIRGMPEKLLIPPGLRETAEIILESKQRSGTADNDYNFFQGGGRNLKIVVNPWFDTADMWIVQNGGMPEAGTCVHYNRWAREFRKDNQFSTLGEAMLGFERYAFSARNWREFYGRVST